MFMKEVAGSLILYAAGTISDLVPLCSPLNLSKLRSHAQRVVGHGEGRAMFSIDDCVQDCVITWAQGSRPNKRDNAKTMHLACKGPAALAENWRRKKLRDQGKRLSFQVALCDRPGTGKPESIDQEISRIEAGEDKTKANRVVESESEQAKEAPKYTAQASPTMRDNARRLSARILPKLGGQIRVDAKIDLGEDFTLVDLVSQGYTQTEIAEQLHVSQGTISNRTKRVAEYFRT